jgi:hypothetical protein
VWRLEPRSYLARERLRPTELAAAGWIADDLNNRLSVTAKALAGYLDAGSGRFDSFFLVTNGARGIRPGWP